ncbi:WD40-repeat-containing domain protein [Globomyces pollinis-pini]|nr:WD40-repeat-containing domain protein [Globomyces pollinis-pini]
MTEPAAPNANFVNVQHKMNINHFEQLMVTFQAHRNEDGSTGFDIDKFREVFGNILGGNLTFDQMTMLFMKIDANSDGTMDWDEFSTYMMTVNSENDESHNLIDERRRKLVNGPHRDMIIRIDYVPKERKYLSVSRDGMVCLWSLSMKLYRTINTREFNARQCWVLDAKYMAESNRLILVTDSRQMCFYDLFAIKPRLISVISYLENNPLCLAVTSDYDESTDMIIFGDDGGYVNVLTLNRRFLVENNSDNGPGEHLNPTKLSKRDSMEKNNMALTRRKIHKEWVLKVQYYREMNAFVSCSLEDEKSLVIGDLERKTIRHISVPKGIETFEFCRRPSFLITGGRDKVIRLWNPYVLSKPAGSLYGHNASIVGLAVNHEEGIIFSLSEDKMIKLWNARNLNCVQTLVDKVAHRPENLITSIYYDSNTRQVITGSGKLETWPLFPNTRQNTSKSHTAPVVSAMFNENFNQVVSGCQSGVITLWDPTCGEKIFEFHRPHGSLELTALCFDLSGRRLITGSRDRTIKMWNFNNGQILRKMYKETNQETTDIAYIEMGLNHYVIVVGWDRKVTIFLDDNSSLECAPIRVLNGAGNRQTVGHEDDITSLSFCEPNILATSSVDGVIVIWNLESGFIKSVLRDPLWEQRSREERAVEKIIFVKVPNTEETVLAPLFSCYADGCLRIWDVQHNRLLAEYNCQLLEDEGLSCLSYDLECKILIVGGSLGHIRLIDLPLLLSSLEDTTVEKPIRVIKYWRAHLMSIASAVHAKTHDMIITSSKDAIIRLWSMNGAHLGTFGDQPWHFLDPENARLPKDLQHEQEIEQKENETSKKQESLLKKRVLNEWQDALPQEHDLDKFNTGDSMEAQASQMMVLRAKAIKAHVCKLFREKWNSMKNGEDWKINPELVTVKKSKQFFSFDFRNVKKPEKPALNVKYDSVYHLLSIHGIEDVSTLPAINHRRDGKSIQGKREIPLS